MVLLLLQAITGLGPIHQLHAETGLPVIVIYALFLGFVGWFGIGGVSPGVCVVLAWRVR